MNLAALQAAIQAKGYGTDTAAQQIVFLNEAYREICGLERWMFLEKQDSTLVTANGTGTYTLPMTDWRSLDAVRISQPTFTYYWNLEYLDPQDFRDLVHVDRDVATPAYWTFMNQQLMFYPIPDGVYTVTIDYIMQPPDLASGTDVPVIPTVYHDVLVWGAVYSLAYRERDWLGRQFAQQEKESLLKRMDEEFSLRQRQTASHVKKTGINSTASPYPFSSSGF